MNQSDAIATTQQVLAAGHIEIPLSPIRAKYLNSIVRDQIGIGTVKLLATRYNILPFRVSTPTVLRVMFSDLPESMLVSDCITLMICAACTGIINKSLLSDSEIRSKVAKAATKPDKRRQRAPKAKLRVDLNQQFLELFDQAFFDEFSPTKSLCTEQQWRLVRPLACSASTQEWSHWFDEVACCTDSLPIRITMRLLRECEMFFLHTLQIDATICTPTRTVVNQFFAQNRLFSSRDSVLDVPSGDSEMLDAIGAYGAILTESAAWHRAEVHPSVAFRVHVCTDDAWDDESTRIGRNTVGGLDCQLHVAANELLLAKLLIRMRVMELRDITPTRPPWFDDWHLQSSSQQNATSKLLTAGPDVVAQFEKCILGDQSAVESEDPAHRPTAAEAAAEQ